MNRKSVLNITCYKQLAIVDQSLFKEWTMSSVPPSNSGWTWTVGRAWRSVRDAWGAAKSISSYLSALLTIRVHPELDGRTLDIVHCFYNIVRHFSRWKVAFSALDKLQILSAMWVLTKNRTTCFFSKTQYSDYSNTRHSMWKFIEDASVSHLIQWI